LREERDASIARELLGMAEEPVAASALAGTSA
ncbi:MAG: hypothetical protein JWN20_1007, partial [Jatrophihabitantaceae bacterium]|nr:hypothetical protein [Jatrophihabitantaceae bacterium]